MEGTNNAQVIYTPTDILNITKEHLRTANTLVVVEGIYAKIGRQDYGGFWYETIKSQFSNQKITVIIPTPLRDQLNDGELVQLQGTIEKKLDNAGQVSLQLRVSGIFGKKEKTIDEAELAALEIQQLKATQGRKDVDRIIEAILYEGERKPNIALLYAEASITDADFKAGIQAASAFIQFNQSGTTFTRIPDFIRKLQTLDSGDFDLICIIRGGGSGIEEVFGNIDLARIVVTLQTPVLSAIGHQQDNPLVCKVTDKNIGTPSLLGQYFKDMVERVSSEKANSKAVLVEQVKKQFTTQIETQGKQIAQLQKQITEESEKHAKEMQQSAIAIEKINATVRAEKKKKQGWKNAVIILTILLAIAILLYLTSL